MRHLFITCFVHFSQICQDNPKTMGTSCLPWQVGVRKKFSSTATSCAYFFTVYFFHSTKHVVFHLSSLFLPTAPQAMERKKKWMLDDFLSATQEKKGLMFLLSWKMTIFPIFLCLLCVGDGDQQIIESCLRVYDYQLFFLYARIKDRWNYTPELYSQAQVILKLSELVFYEKIMANCKQYWWKFPFIETIYF